MKGNIPFLVAIIAVLILLFLGIQRETEALKKIQRELIYDTENIGKSKLSGTLIPAIDIRKEILRKRPNIALEANLILSKKGSAFESIGEFTILFDYYYLLNDHANAIDVFKRYVDSSQWISNRIIYLLDRNYLLPAFLYERLGVMDLSEKYYRIYLESLRHISFRHAFLGKSSFQRRLTVARVKLFMLEESKSKRTDHYYEGSYLSALIYDFFENSTKSAFLKSYVNAGLFESVPVDLEEIHFSPDVLMVYAAGRSLTNDPYPYFELCAYKINQQHSWYSDKNWPRSCSAESIVKSLPDNHILKPLLLINLGKWLQHNGEHSQAIKIYRLLQSGKFESGRFLSDDAALYEAIIHFDPEYRESGGKEKGLRLLRKLIFEYEQGQYDAVPFARQLVERLGG